MSDLFAVRSSADLQVGAIGEPEGSLYVASPPRVGVRIALGLIRAYQLIVSPIFTGSCRFLPSCSQYAAEAVERYGVLRGSWLAARRLARCHPFCEGGHDPVPAVPVADAQGVSRS